MSVSIIDRRMRGDRSGHVADLVGAGRWRVSWLPDRLVSRDQATTALVLAETLATRPAPGSRLRRFVVGWAAEVAVTVDQAVALLDAHEPQPEQIVDRPGGYSAKNPRQAGPSSTHESEGSAS